jgi:hypothetical protein
MRRCAASKRWCEKAMQTTRLVASLSRTWFSEQEAELSRSLLRSEVDWDGFLTVAQSHHVVPLVWGSVRVVDGAEYLPDWVRRDLKE